MSDFQLPFPSDDELRKEIREELDAHQAFAQEDLERAGVPQDEVAERVAARMGDRETLETDLLGYAQADRRKRRALGALHDFVMDLRFAGRRMRRHPVLATAAVAALALGIGTFVAFGGAVDRILLRPLPLEAPDRLVTLWRGDPRNAELRNGLAVGTALDLAEGSRSFAAIAAAQPYSLEIERDGELLNIGTWRVTRSYFDALRTQPHLGRLLEARDFVAGSDPSIVVSFDFFQRHLGGRPESIGGSQRFNGTPMTIVGVLPQDFPLLDGRDFFVPIIPVGNARENRVADFWSAFGRLKEGVAYETGVAELTTLAQRSDALAPPSAGTRTLIVERLDASVLGGVRPALLLLGVGALLLLTLAVANASGLLLSDTMGRARELAVRAAVGAGLTRITRQLLAESALLGAAAGALGLALGAVGLQLLRGWVPSSVPRLAELGVDARSVWLGIGVTVAVTLVLGITPIRFAARDLHDALRGGSDASSRGGRRLRTVLTAAQIAISVMLLCSGGLLLRSWSQLMATEQGYDASGVVGVEQHFWHLRRSDAEREAAGRAMESRLKQTPGIAAAGVASSLPLAAEIGSTEAFVQRPGFDDGQQLYAVVASPGFFDALRVPALQGRVFNEFDGLSGEPVAVISAAAARRYFGDLDPVGQTLLIGNSPANAAARRVVGVVPDLRYTSMETAGRPAVYVPHAQSPTASVFVIARGATRGGAALAAVSEAMEQELGPVPSNESVTLESLQRAASLPRRFSLMLLATFAVVAVVLTMLGLFGQLMQVVGARQHEIGVRLALGALPARVRRMLLAEGLRLAAVGAAIGIAAFLAASRVLSRFAFGVAPRDPLTVAAVAAAILLVAMLASWIPASRATRVSPMRALRAG